MQPRIPLPVVMSIVSIVLVSPLACAHHSSNASCLRPAPATSQLGVITRAEIEGINYRYENAYDLIHALRPIMLQTRGSYRMAKSRDGSRPSTGGLNVYLDDVYVGGVDALKSISVRSIVSVRHLTGLDATTRYGTGMTDGAIAISTSAILPR